MPLCASSRALWARYVRSLLSVVCCLLSALCRMLPAVYSLLSAESLNCLFMPPSALSGRGPCSFSRIFPLLPLPSLHTHFFPVAHRHTTLLLSLTVTTPSPHYTHTPLPSTLSRECLPQVRVSFGAPLSIRAEIARSPASTPREQTAGHCSVLE